MSRDAFAQIERDLIADEQDRDDLRDERERGKRIDAMEKARDKRMVAGAQAVGMLSSWLKRGQVPAHAIDLATQIVRDFDHAYDEYDALKAGATK